MGLAKMTGANVVLVGDIEQGAGSSLSLWGPLIFCLKMTEEPGKGLVISRFRGDKALLDPGLKDA